MNWRALTISIGIAAIMTEAYGQIGIAEASGKRRCLVLADGYLSEYAMGRYDEATYNPDHPGHDFIVRGLLEYPGRFNRWLDGWEVRRVDLDRHSGALRLDGIDLLILDDVRQSVCDPYETAIVEFVRGGGALLVNAGQWGLGGCPKNDYCVTEVISNYQLTPLGAILPVEILSVPDLAYPPEQARQPAFIDASLGDGIDTERWHIFGLHACKARGEVLAELDGKPLVCTGDFGNGRVVVYTGDDLAWVRAGTWRGEGSDRNINKLSGALWRRLAALAVRDTRAIPAIPDPPPTWEKRPAFAHPDQPMNLLWLGTFYYQSDDMLQAWKKDLVTHCSTLIGEGNALRFSPLAADAGVLGVESLLRPTRAAEDDPKTWMLDGAGEPISGSPCLNNPETLRKMHDRMAERARELAKFPSVVYGHMGDETEFNNCYCEYCRKAFRAQFGGDLPKPRDDFSPAYLDRWIDYHLFKNKSVGQMYARAIEGAQKTNPRLRMFASLPQSGGMCHGDDQFNTQSAFDILWDHTYPGTNPVRVGFNAALLEETAFLQGRPYVPIFDLLQGFDAYDQVAHVPPAEYMRAMAWQAISHGIDSVGWFVYNHAFWNLPGSAAWEEIGRLGREVLEPMTPTLYEMRNAPQPVGLLNSYSQEAVDGLKELAWKDNVDASKASLSHFLRWYSLHANHEAHEILKYAHVPFNVVSEHRLFAGKDLPWKVIIIPYVEHLHRDSRKGLETFMARGGTVYVGANSTLDLPGIKKLPMRFDTKFHTWWPQNRKDELHQRRVRAYVISASLEKARQLRNILAPDYEEQALVTLDDPEVVYNVREAGVAKYIFVINDHQINPVSAEMRKKRQEYMHFMLMPAKFPDVSTQIGIKGPGYAYSLLSSGDATVELEANERTSWELKLNGGDGKLFLLLPEKITKVEFVGRPRRTRDGVVIGARVLGTSGVLDGSLPLKVDLTSGSVQQTAYATTKNGMLSWTVPYLKAFPNTPITVTITDLASGKSAHREVIR